MKMKNKKLLAIVLLSLSFCFVSGVGPVAVLPEGFSFAVRNLVIEGYREAQWGMSPDEVKQVFPGESFSQLEQEDELVYYFGFDDTILGHKVRIWFYFFDNQLYKVAITPPSPAATGSFIKGVGEGISVMAPGYQELLDRKREESKLSELDILERAVSGREAQMINDYLKRVNEGMTETQHQEAVIRLQKLLDDDGNKLLLYWVNRASKPITPSSEPVTPSIETLRVENFRRLLIQKYGPPTGTGDLELQWQDESNHRITFDQGYETIKYLDMNTINKITQLIQKKEKQTEEEALGKL